MPLKMFSKNTLRPEQLLYVSRISLERGGQLLIDDNLLVKTHLSKIKTNTTHTKIR